MSDDIGVSVADGAEALADRRAAARMLGSLGGRRNTPAQLAARERNRLLAVAGRRREKASVDQGDGHPVKGKSVKTIIQTASDC